MQILLIFATHLLYFTFAFRLQSIGIRGQLMCGMKPLHIAQIKIFNKNIFGK